MPDPEDPREGEAEDLRQPVNSGEGIEGEDRRDEITEVSPAADQPSANPEAPSATQPTTGFEERDSSALASDGIQMDGAADKPEKLPDPGTSDTSPNVSAPNNVSNDIPLKSLPDIDEYGMPLLGRTQRAKTSAQNGTKIEVKQGAPISNISAVDSTIPVWRQPQSRKSAHVKKHKPRRRWITFRQGIGCLFRMAILALIAGIVLVIASGSI
ncbi:MAG: hypothetical protein ACM3H7_04615, partial [Acidobacteriaceae bacterium]